MARDAGIIEPQRAVTLNGLFLERVSASPAGLAYRQYESDTARWQDYTWAETAADSRRWQIALEGEGLAPGDRVAVMMRNCREWVLFDQAALGLGLVVVPLYRDDRAENVAYILKDAGAKVLLLEGADQWHAIAEAVSGIAELQRVVTLSAVNSPKDQRLRRAADWVMDGETHEPEVQGIATDGLATICYTSGTTGRPKGVMLSHRNILENAWASLQLVPELGSQDRFLSFLPLSHMLERTCGYYLPMMAGATVVFARSIEQLADDLQSEKPTALISVPRIYERAYNRIHRGLAQGPRWKQRLFQKAVDVGWERFEHRQDRGPRRARHLLWPLFELLVARKLRARLGGRLRFAVSGGAPLNPDVARTFVGLGVPVLQGYGLTEASPVVSGNAPTDNLPHTVGRPLPGVEIKVGDDDELLLRGPNVMLGYWNRPDATRETIDSDGWLHSGDQARVEDGHIVIIGRLKEIIVLATGEKVPPLDMEMAIAADPLVEEEHVLVLGESRPYLSALLVINRETWPEVARARGFAEDPGQVEGDERVEELFLERVSERLSQFPGYAQVRRVSVMGESWSIDNALLTPTLKPRRKRIEERYRAHIERMYRSEPHAPSGADEEEATRQFVTPL